MSFRRNLDLWNLYSSDFGVMERRGDFDLDIGSELGVLQAHGPLFRVVPFMSSFINAVVR